MIFNTDPNNDLCSFNIVCLNQDQYLDHYQDQYERLLLEITI